MQIENKTNTDRIKQMTQDFYCFVSYITDARFSIMEIISFLDLTGNIMSKSIRCKWDSLLFQISRANDHYDSFLSAAEEMEIEGLLSDESSYIAIYTIESCLSSMEGNCRSIDNTLSVTGRVFFEGHKSKLRQLLNDTKNIIDEYKIVIEENKPLFSHLDFERIGVMLE